MEKILKFYKTKIVILILIPMLILISYFLYEKDKAHDFYYKKVEQTMANIVLQEEAFIEEILVSPPLILNQDKKANKIKLDYNKTHALENLLLEYSINRLTTLGVIGIYSLEQEQIVFHMGLEDIYFQLENEFFKELLKKEKNEQFYTKYNNFELNIVPIIRDQQIVGLVYTYYDGEEVKTSPFQIILLFIFSLIFALVGARWVEIKNERRIQQLKQELDNIKNTGESLPIYDDEFGEIAQSVNDLKEHLSSEKELMRITLDSLPLGVIVYDENGQASFVNDTATRITGFDKNEIKQFTVSGNILNSIEKNVFWETLRSGESFLGFESYCPTKNGIEVPVMTSTKPLYDASNNFIGIISSFIDISEQERLRKIEQHAKIMLDHITDGVMRVDNNGVISGFNSGAEKMTGFKAEEVLGKKYDDIFIKRKTIFTKLTQTLHTKKEYSNYKKLMTTNDGRKVHLMITTKILRDEKGEQIGAMGIYKDITHLEELEQQIQRADKLAIVGELAAGTAHEIRNPLTTIKGFIQLLKNEIKDKAKQEFINQMLKEINHINDIIKEMLLLAKPANPCKAPVFVNQIIEDIVVFMGSEAVLYNVEINTKLQDELPIVHIDERQIKQVFINLIRNAIQAMGNGGIITIHSLFNEKNQMTQVTFEDQGDGIPEEQLAKIYEPFYTTKEEGTGLGIPVSYRIMKSHDGDLQINSKVGKGTSVTLYLPTNMDEF